MQMATESVDPSQIVCECGRDHRGTNTRRCPIFSILHDVYSGIENFLYIQEIIEFGKDGPMAHCLRSSMIFSYDLVMKTFQKWEAASKEHPEWNLAEELSRLRRYADQITIGCAEEKNMLGPDPPPSVVEPIVGDEDMTLQGAKSGVLFFYGTCHEVISEYVGSEGTSVMCKPDAKKVLDGIEREFTSALEDIMDLPKTQNATFRDLTQRLYDIRKETRRLLCDFKPRFRFIVPVDDES